MTVTSLHHLEVSLAQSAAGSFTLLCASTTGSSERTATLNVTDDEALDAKVSTWLRRVGLGDTNPFEQLEAGADPNLSQYLVPHDVFDLLWQDHPTIVYAPPGGGKSAFRVRLSWACRVGQDGRQIFSIPYLAPEPDATQMSSHLQPILKRAARELFLVLAYRPARFLHLAQADRVLVRQVLDQNSPDLVSRFVRQLRRAGSLDPLIEGHDASARRLTDPPPRDRVVALCDALTAIPESHEVPPATLRFDALMCVVRHVLGFESVYLLVDGIDAWMETRRDPSQGAMVLDPLLREMASWRNRDIYLKLFLPVELQKVLPCELTKHAQSAIIEWDSRSLAEVLHRRLEAASGRRFSRLSAISTLALDDPEGQLLLAIRPSPTPRELLVLVNRLIQEHVRSDTQEVRLQPQDVQAAIRWYESQAKVLPSDSR